MNKAKYMQVYAGEWLTATTHPFSSLIPRRGQGTRLPFQFVAS